MRAADCKQSQRTHDLRQESSALSVDWLTARETAEYLKVGQRTVCQWARQGKIPGHRLSGCARVTWRFSRRELDEMLSKSA